MGSIGFLEDNYVKQIALDKVTLITAKHRAEKLIEGIIFKDFKAKPGEYCQMRLSKNMQVEKIESIKLRKPDEWIKVINLINRIRLK